MNDKSLFQTQLNKSGLDIPANWGGDPRNKFEILFAPLIKNTAFSFKHNMTDHSAKILEVYRGQETRRIMGIRGKRDMIITVFFNPDLYKVIEEKVDLPGNEKSYRSQPHMDISIEKMWDVMCALTDKMKYIVGRSRKPIVKKIIAPTDQPFHVALWKAVIEYADDNPDFSRIFKSIKGRNAATKTYFTLPWRGEDLLLCASYRSKEKIVRLSILINHDELLADVMPHIGQIEKAINHKLDYRHKNGQSSEFNWDLRGIVESVDQDNLLSITKWLQDSAVLLHRALEKYVFELQKSREEAEQKRAVEEKKRIIADKKNAQELAEQLRRQEEEEKQKAFISSLVPDNYDFEKMLHEGKQVALCSRKEFYVAKHYTKYNKTIFDRLCKLNLEGIPRFISVKEVDGDLFTLEEYIEGEDLNSVFKREGLFPEERVIDIATQLCEILERLHALKPPFIHRDIKPSNIILQKEGKVVLIDFNASKEYHEETTEDTILLGTHHFAAPEQLLGYGASDVRTDIYGIGATMNYLLTGMYINQLAAIGPIGEVIKKCTKMDKENRYENVKKLKEALKKLKAD